MMKGRCPYCDGEVSVLMVRTRRYGQVKRGGMKAFEMSVPAVMAEGMPMGSEPLSTERRVPARAASFESDVLVPAAQAGITGLVALLPAGFLTAYAGWHWYVALEIGGGVMTLSWLYLLDAHRRLLWLVERFTNKDIDGDAMVGDPSARTEAVELTVRHDEGGIVHRQQIFDLPEGVSVEMLRTFAQRAPVMGLSQGAWTGGGNLFSRAQYERLMGTMQAAGIVAWVDADNKAQGRRLTRAGKAALAWLAKGE